MPSFQFNLEPTKIINPETQKEIVSNKSLFHDISLEKTKHKLFNEQEVRKYFVPIDCSYWDLDLITYVEPRTIIPEHSHSEPVLRYVLEGSLELNGETYEVGDWVLVPANIKYRIQTKSGYKILSRYHADCKACTWSTLSKMPLEKMDQQDVANP